MKNPILFALVAALAAALPASAKWTVTTEGAPSGCTHVISDGNWKIGVFRYSDSNWNLGRETGKNSNTYVEGSGVLDLRDLASDCGVVLKSSSNGALEGGKPITEVYFPDSFESMVGNTFKGDTALTKVVFQSGFKSIGHESFYNCSGLVSVTFPDTLETIAYSGFYGCSSLELDDFTFPESLATVGDHAFTGCTKITGKLTFPGLKTLTGSFQFENCTGMTEFVAPNLLNTAEGMFNKCTALTSATFSPDIETIAYQSFKKGDNRSAAQLRSFSPTTMPKLKTLGQEAFRGQLLLVGDFDFSQSSITELPYYAFVDDTYVRNVKLPESLEKIGGAALGLGKGDSRYVWFCGPPPEMDDRALDPNNGKSWVLVAGVRHAQEWENDANLLPFENNEKATAVQACKDLGLTGVKPIGKWKYQTGSSTHWVVEELSAATMVLIY